MRMLPRTVAAVMVSLLLFGCERKRADCGPDLEIRIDNTIGMTQRQLRIAEAREFLWNHWHERKCATLLLKSISKEGKETDTNYEVKLLPAASPVMLVTGSHARYGYQGQVFWRESPKYEVYTVERVQPNNPYLLNPSSNVEVLPENAILQGSDYCLRLKGWGSEVLSFF